MDWIFQCNSDTFDLRKKLQEGLLPEESWWRVSKVHEELVQPGQRVYFWQTPGKTPPKMPSALVATGRVASRPHHRYGRLAVDVIFEDSISPELTRAEAKTSPILEDVEPFRGKVVFGRTNFRLTDVSVVQEVDRLLRGRLRRLSSFSEQSAQQHDVEGERTLLDAAADAKARTAALLLSEIAQMDPRDFEFLTQRVLVSQGYEDVTVTQYSRDGGIDVLATLVAGGVSRILTGVQVKRTSSVGVKELRQLRGSLDPIGAAAGLFVTSGTFSSDAIVFAKSAGKPLALLPGPQLVNLMMRNEIGVRMESVPVYRLALEDLRHEELDEAEEGIDTDEGSTESP